MAITVRPPNVINLSGDLSDGSVENRWPAGIAITPGHLIKSYNVAGVMSWKPNDSATDLAAPIVALSQPEWNRGVDVQYAIGDVVSAWYMERGDCAWMFIASGQNITIGDALQSAGDGTLKAATATTAAANVAKFKALETQANVTVLTRIRVEAL